MKELTVKKKNYLDIDICKKCGGRCCKSMPGSTYPEDFEKPLLENLVEAFKSGNWAIDWWEGDPTNKNNLEKAYYIRPRTKGDNDLFDPSYGGECIFLNEKGCTLKSEERPQSCRLLEPKEDGACILHGKSKRGAAIAWLSFTTVILKAAKIVTKKNQRRKLNGENEGLRSR